MKSAVILSGCGHKDGTELREAILLLLAADQENIEVDYFAPFIKQKTFNHITNEATGERDLAVEASRISRGKIHDIKDLIIKDFDALLIPGGLGVIKSLSRLNSQSNYILPELVDVIYGFYKAGKPIGAICIAPALVAVALHKHKIDITVTLGEDTNPILAGTNATHKKCKADQICIDEKNNVISTPAYMLDAGLAEVSIGISKLVRSVKERAEVRR